MNSSPEPASNNTRPSGSTPMLRPPPTVTTAFGLMT